MIPYIHIDDLHLGPVTLHPFGLLVAAALIVGTSLATRRARHLGLDVAELNSFIGWMLVGGFVGGHVLDSLFYHPAEVLVRPWSLLFLWEGLSSFGGFVGAFIGVLLWKYFELEAFARVGARLVLKRPMRRAKAVSILPYCDVILAVLPVAWVFGRSGCAVVHDHPGARASATTIFAVAYGNGISHSYGFFELRHGDSPQYDLGLLELMFTVVLACIFALTWKRRLPLGFYAIAACLAYAPIRFALDFLRVQVRDGGDPRYASLTPAQWACIGLFMLGIGLWIRRPDHSVAS